MPIQFTCPRCGRQTEVAGEYAGQSGPCAGCGVTITVPAPSGLQAYTPRSSAAATIGVVLAIAGGLSMLACCGGVFLGFEFPRDPRSRACCSNNLRSIGLALLQYEAANRQFPPACLADEDGRPLHSWRVLILPYLGETGLFEQFRLNEPWDSPHNLAVAARVPPVYRCPADELSDVASTSYMMLVGPGTVSEGRTGHRLEEITDGPADTILVVEAAESDVFWTRPDDLDTATLSFEINDYSPPPAIHSRHDGGVLAVMCDGSVRWLSDATSAERVKAMATIAGRETLAEKPAN